jgi:hypothetical protein
MEILVFTMIIIKLKKYSVRGEKKAEVLWCESRWYSNHCAGTAPKKTEDANYLSTSKKGNISTNPGKLIWIITRDALFKKRLLLQPKTADKNQLNSSVRHAHVCTIVAISR